MNSWTPSCFLRLVCWCWEAHTPTFELDPGTQFTNNLRSSQLSRAGRPDGLPKSPELQCKAKPGLSCRMGQGRARPCPLPGTLTSQKGSAGTAAAPRTCWLGGLVLGPPTYREGPTVLPSGSIAFETLVPAFRRTR